MGEEVEAVLCHASQLCKSVYLVNLRGERLADHGYILKRNRGLLRTPVAKQPAWGMAACVSVDHEAAYFFGADERATQDI